MHCPAEIRPHILALPAHPNRVLGPFPLPVGMLAGLARCDERV
jgi:hypothetical protein